ncbi:MAG: hypothetical protein U0892_14780 [Pirellulales bacterium]
MMIRPLCVLLASFLLCPIAAAQSIVLELNITLYDRKLSDEAVSHVREQLQLTAAHGGPVVRDPSLLAAYNSQAKISDRLGTTMILTLDKQSVAKADSLRMMSQVKAKMLRVTDTECEVELNWLYGAINENGGGSGSWGKQSLVLPFNELTVLGSSSSVMKTKGKKEQSSTTISTALAVRAEEHPLSDDEEKDCFSKFFLQKRQLFPQPLRVPDVQ